MSLDIYARATAKFGFPVLVAISPVLVPHPKKQKQSRMYWWAPRALALIAVVVISAWDAVVGLLAVIFIMSLAVTSYTPHKINKKTNQRQL